MNQPDIRFRDILILTAWIGGLLCISGLCWFLTGPIRINLLQQSINRAWSAEESLRIEAPVPSANLSPGLSRLGAWYTLTGGNRVLVFNIIADGIFLPCAAIVDSSGAVEKITPLAASGEKLLGRVSPGIIKLHIRRIQGEP